MRGKRVKFLKNYTIDHLEDVLIQVRNFCGKDTEQMGPLQIQKQVKRMYKKGLLKIN